jgi:prepilin peptidase CpaA
MSADTSALALIVVGGVTAAVIDLRVRRIPNALTLSLAAAGITLAAMGLGRVDLPAALTGCLLGLALMLPGHLFGATGAGDVKLLAAAGTLLGPADVFKAFIFMTLAGAAIALAVALSRGRLAEVWYRTLRLAASRGASAAEIEHETANNRFAYAPAIAVGAMLAAL